MAPPPSLFLCCFCVTTEESREVPQPSRLSPFERKGTKWQRAAASRPGSNSPSHHLPVLPFHPWGNINSPGS